MKKAVSLLLVLSMALALCACGSGKQAKSDPAANDGVGFSADKIESISENMDDNLLIWNSDKHCIYLLDCLYKYYNKI